MHKDVLHTYQYIAIENLLLVGRTTASIHYTHLIMCRLDDDDDDNMDSLVQRIPADCSALHELMITSQGCVLLLQIKQHLKEMYAITDG